MSLRVCELHAASEPGALNQEWIVLENTGDTAFNTRGCRLQSAARKGARLHPVGTLDPGFLLRPGEKHRIVSGSPSKKAQGAPPADAIANYYLFAHDAILKDGVVVALAHNQVELCRAEHDPKAPGGLAKE